MKALRIPLLLAIMLFGLVLSAGASSLLISQETPYLGYGYGLGSWTAFDAAINTAFNNNVTLYGSDLNDLNYMEQFDALMVVARQPYGQGLSATEIANITAYIGTGRRVFLIGENSAWASWNNSILATVGGSYSGNDTSNTLNRVVVNDITMNSPVLYTIADGIATGGVSLYDLNVLTLWGDNVVSLLSINVLDDSYGAGNAAFKTDMANWLASSGVPEPGTLLMLGSGIAGVAALLRRKLG